MGRTAAGVRGIHLREGDEVVDMAIVDPTATLLTVCENGYGKRTSFEEYRLQGRGGYGVINIKTTERNGKVVAMKSIRDADELMLITQGGMIVRIGAADLRTIGRATQGVRLIALKEDDKLVGVARVVAEDNGHGQLAAATTVDSAAVPPPSAPDAGQQPSADSPQGPPPTENPGPADGGDVTAL